MVRQALEELKVLDFCWVVAGPMTTKYLAEHGATVVRVESRNRPEQLRNGGPFKDSIPGINRSGYFANNNPNKYGITLSLRHEKAKELVFRMVAWADMVAENFTPGTMERLGLGYDDLKQINPGIIMFSTSMLGRGGPYDSQPGFGAVMASLSGLTNITGWSDRSPVNPYGAYTDYVVARFGVTAVLAALDYRKRTGQGLHLDMSQMEASLQLSAPILLDWAANGREPQRMGNRHAWAAPHGIFPCAGEDRWIAITCFTDAHWAALRTSMGDPSWAAEKHLATPTGRKASENSLDVAIAQWTIGWDALTLTQLLQNVGVPSGAVQDCRDLSQDPQLEHRGHYQHLEHPELGVYATDRSEFTLSLTPGNLDRPSPLIGQHTEYVLKELIGLTDEEYQSLEQEGALI
jgi:benzylsuccinate CoA-transferase BbsF subunit